METLMENFKVMNHNQQPPRFISYWLGYRSKDDSGKLTPRLEETPDYVDVVVLAFALVQPGNIIDTRFMYNPPNTERSIIEGVADLKKRGKKVLLSVGGWGGNCWTSVTDVPALAASILRVVDEWGLDGVDVDYEEDHCLQDWMTVPPCPDASSQESFDVAPLIRELRSKLGPDRILTLVTAGDYPEPILELNWVSTMDYAGSYLYGRFVSRYLEEHPNTNVLPFSLGIAALDDSKQPRPIDEVRDFCEHKPPLGPLRIMFWDLSEDNPGFTKLPLWKYAEAINATLPT